MAHIKKLAAQNYQITEKAIQVHAGYVSCVAGLIKKYGQKAILEKPEYKWIKKAQERVLDFAEQVQIKQIPTTFGGNGENGEFLVKVEISDADHTTQEPGNRIQEYVKV